MTTQLPNFIYVGTGKAGTTWLFATLAKHADVYLTDSKETNFFDLNFERGTEWYGGFFSKAQPKQIVGEIAHRYLRNPEIAQRIHDTVGPVKILIGLREPTDYYLSEYLFTKRNGQTSLDVIAYADDGFDWEALEYRTMLEPYVEIFGADNILICDFSELKRSPQKYLDEVTSFLGVAQMQLEADDTKKVNPAKSARLKGVARMATSISKWLKRRGGQRIIQTVKSSIIVQRVLYQPVKSKPTISGDLENRILNHSAQHLDWVDMHFKTNLKNSWYGA